MTKLIHILPNLHYHSLSLGMKSPSVLADIIADRTGYVVNVVDRPAVLTEGRLPEAIIRLGVDWTDAGADTVFKQKFPGQPLPKRLGVFYDSLIPFGSPLEISCEQMLAENFQAVIVPSRHHLALLNHEFSRGYQIGVPANLDQTVKVDKSTEVVIGWASPCNDDYNYRAFLTFSTLMSRMIADPLRRNALGIIQNLDQIKFRLISEGPIPQDLAVPEKRVELLEAHTPAEFSRYLSDCDLLLSFAENPVHLRTEILAAEISLQHELGNVVLVMDGEVARESFAPQALLTRKVIETLAEYNGVLGEAAGVHEHAVEVIITKFCNLWETSRSRALKATARRQASWFTFEDNLVDLLQEILS